jgi:D-alanyl-D-alanine carboxypeptidase (penicillin-binding protein 5/6)
VFGGLALVLATAFYLPVALLAPLTPAQSVVLPYAPPAATPAEIPWPDYGASAVGAVGSSDLLGSSGVTQAVPMASISKVITALVVLDAKPLAVGATGPQVQMTAADEEYYRRYLALNGSLASVHAGLVLTELQLLQLMLVPSANNYAASVVVWAFGSEDAFVAAATTWLSEHGLDETTVLEPTGIDPRNTSSAADLVDLGRLALADPVVAGIVATTKVKIPGVGVVRTTNELLGMHGMTGLKTGTLEEWGANLLFSAQRRVGAETVAIVGVVLGGADHPTIDADIREMVDAVFAGFHEVVLTTAGAVFGSFTTEWGERADLVAAGDASAVVWSDIPITGRVEVDQVVTAAAGEDVGVLDVRVGAREVEVPLELASALDGPGPGWRLTHPF